VLPEPPTYEVPELERLARELLGQYFGSDIIIPVDVDLFVERVDGVDLDYWPGLRANHGIEGMIARDPKTGRLFVFIDDKLADTQPTRYRMTVAEELGHLVLHRKMIDQVHSPDDFKELQQHYRWHGMERNAKRFAAAILMPGDAVTAHAARWYPQFVKAAGFGNAPAILRQLAVTLAKEFEVSTQTMEYRLDEWPMRIKKRVEESVRDHVDFLA
jgi:hypothetical protein